MIDLAKQLNNNADMIRLAQIFSQQPRNSVSIIFLLFLPILCLTVKYHSLINPKFLTVKLPRKTQNSTGSSIANFLAPISVFSVETRPETCRWV